jgi:hypothetical protein
MREELERREQQASRGDSELQTARNRLNAEVAAAPPCGENKAANIVTGEGYIG